MRRLTDFAPKRARHCSQCGAELWGKGATREERKGFRASFMLLDGSLMDLTMCEGCAGVPDLEHLWGQVLAGWRYAKPEDAGMRATVARQARDNLILALLYRQRWADVEAGIQWRK